MELRAALLDKNGIAREGVRFASILGGDRQHDALERHAFGPDADAWLVRTAGLATDSFQIAWKTWWNANRRRWSNLLSGHKRG